MYFKSNLIFLSAYLGALVFSLPTEIDVLVSENIAVRAACNADNCLRSVRNTRLDPVSASSYCQSLFDSIIETVTVTSTSTFTFQPAQPTVITTIGTTTEIVEYTCETSLDGPFEYYKRAASTPFASVVSSACPALNGLNQAQRISSACSCFLTTPVVTTTSISTTTLPTPEAATITTSYLVTERQSVCTATETIYGPPRRIKLPCEYFPSPVQSTTEGKVFTKECGYMYRLGEGTVYSGEDASFKTCINMCGAQEDCVAITVSVFNSCNFYTRTQLARTRDWDGSFGLQNEYHSRALLVGVDINNL